jgi:hypothetical protein
MCSGVHPSSHAVAIETVRSLGADWMPKYIAIVCSHESTFEMLWNSTYMYEIPKNEHVPEVLRKRERIEVTAPNFDFQLQMQRMRKK